MCAKSAKLRDRLAEEERRQPLVIAELEAQAAADRRRESEARRDALRFQLELERERTIRATAQELEAVTSAD